MQRAYGNTPDPYSADVTIESDGGYYAISLTAVDGSESFVLTAAASPGTTQSQPKEVAACGSFRINELGQLSVSADGYTVGSDLAQQCWR